MDVVYKMCLLKSNIKNRISRISWRSSCQDAVHSLPSVRVQSLVQVAKILQAMGKKKKKKKSMAIGYLKETYSESFL